jgi:LCP family protein required for cell wall assembly
MSWNDPQYARHRRSSGSSAGRSSRRNLGLAGRVVVTLVSLSLLIGTGYAYATYRSLGQTIQSVTIPALHGHNTAPTKGPTGPGQDINILVVGDDAREGLTAAQEKELHTGSDVSQSTDVVMIVHIPANGRKATIASLPRDSYVNIGHGYIENKLNAVFADAYSDRDGTPEQDEAAGANLLIETVESLTGVTINRYVQVGFTGFEQIADVIGTLPVNLCESVDDSYSGFDQTAGKHNLNAIQMLQFVRQRHGLPLGDVDREKRQQYFLAEAFKKVFSTGVLTDPSALNKLVSIIKKSFIIDGFSSIAQFADQMSGLTGGNITGQVIPYTVGPDNTPVGDVLTVDPAKVQAFIKKLFADTTPTPKPSTSASPTSTSTSTSPAKPKPKPKATCID